MLLKGKGRGVSERIIKIHIQVPLPKPKNTPSLWVLHNISNHFATIRTEYSVIMAIQGENELGYLASPLILWITLTRHLHQLMSSVGLASPLILRVLYVWHLHQYYELSSFGISTNFINSIHLAFSLILWVRFIW